MKKLIITIFALVMMISLVAVASAQNVYVNRAQVIPSSNEVMINVALENNVNYDFGRTRLSMMSYDIPFIVKKRAVAFDEGKVLSKTLVEPLNDVKPGFYTIRISAHNDKRDFRSVIHREIYVDAYGNVY